VWTGYVNDHSSPLSTEVKNVWSYIPQYVFMAWYLYKQWDFTFLPLLVQCSLY